MTYRPEVHEDGVVNFQKGFIQGFLPSHGADTDHDMSITAGACRDLVDSLNVRSAIVYEKQTDALWVAGDGVGGLFSGAGLLGLGDAGKNASLAAGLNNPRGLWMNDAGTQLWVVGPDGSGEVVTFTLGTPYDISTLSYDSNLFVPINDGVESIFVGDNGNKLYLGSHDNNVIRQYSLGTAYDLSTVSDDSLTISVSNPQSFQFKPDGTRLMILSGGSIEEWHLSSAWDLGSASGVESFIVTNEEATPDAFQFNADGTLMILVGGAGFLYQYVLTTGWDTLTMTYDNVTVDMSSTIPFSSPGLHVSFLTGQLWICDGQVDIIYEFDMGVAPNDSLHAILIQNDTTKVFDWGYDTSIIGANTPVGWTAIRRMFSIRTDSNGNIINGSWNELAGGELEMSFIVPVQDWTDDDPGETAIINPISVPAGVLIKPRLYVVVTDGSPTVNHHILVTSEDQADTVPNGQGPRSLNTGNSAGEGYNASFIDLLITSGRVRHRTTGATDADFEVTGEVHGWTDFRR